MPIQKFNLANFYQQQNTAPSNTTQVAASSYIPSLEEIQQSFTNKQAAAKQEYLNKRGVIKPDDRSEWQKRKAAARMDAKIRAAGGEDNLARHERNQAEATRLMNEYVNPAAETVGGAVLSAVSAPLGYAYFASLAAPSLYHNPILQGESGDSKDFANLALAGAAFLPMKIGKAPIKPKPKPVLLEKAKYEYQPIPVIDEFDSFNLYDPISIDTMKKSDRNYEIRKLFEIGQNPKEASTHPLLSEMDYKFNLPENTKSWFKSVYDRRIKQNQSFDINKANDNLSKIPVISITPELYKEGLDLNVVPTNASGWYNPRSNKIYIQNNVQSPKLVLQHELRHAMQYQYPQNESESKFLQAAYHDVPAGDLSYSISQEWEPMNTTGRSQILNYHWSKGLFNGHDINDIDYQNKLIDETDPEIMKRLTYGLDGYWYSFWKHIDQKYNPTDQNKKIQAIKDAMKYVGGVTGVNYVTNQNNNN